MKKNRVNPEGQQGPTLLERVDVELATRLADGSQSNEPIANAQRVFDRLRRPARSDAAFISALLRLRGFVVDDDDARAVLADRPSRLAPVNQEFRMIKGLAAALRMLRDQAAAGNAPDGWFAVELWKLMTTELPRFRNNDIRRGAPWDSVLYVNYPAPDQLRYLLDTFDERHYYRDNPMLFGANHPVRQGFRIMWRFARIAPFPDFNVVMGWLLMTHWLLLKGYPIIVPEAPDQVMIARLLGGPPPTRIVQFERRLLDAVCELRHVG
ncbi:MAG: hypothetical protein NXI31_08250 [bacterium]|nr:hypothetical protein [bacterium]